MNEHDEAATQADPMRRALLAALPALLAVTAADAQDATKIQPGRYKVLVDNDFVRVLDVTSRPGVGLCGSGRHSHPDHMVVALTPAKVRVKSPDGTSIEVENKVGDVFYAKAETHETENIGGREVRALLIEFKPAARRAI